jgi:hypothetical protein
MLLVHRHQTSLIENQGKKDGWPETLEHLKNQTSLVREDCLLIETSIDLLDMRFCMNQLRKNAMKKLIVEQTQL